jgi:hypothetical protein
MHPLRLQKVWEWLTYSPVTLIWSTHPVESAMQPTLQLALRWNTMAEYALKMIIFG